MLMCRGISFVRMRLYVRVCANRFVAVTMGQGTDGESVCMSSATAVDWRSVSDPA